MSTKLPQISACCVHNLERIEMQFPRAVQLTVDQAAVWLQKSDAAIHKMIERGVFKFPIARNGSQNLFPVFYLAAWACGEFEDEEAIVVSVPKSTPLRSRSKDSYKSRLLSLKIDIEARAKKIRKDEDQTVFLSAKEKHIEAIGELQALYEKKMLSANSGVSERKKPAGGFTL